MDATWPDARGDQVGTRHVSQHQGKGTSSLRALDAVWTTVGSILTKCSHGCCARHDHVFLCLDSFIARDEKKAVSAIHVVDITICNLCNHRGACDYDSYEPILDSEILSFRMADCICDIGYTGELPVMAVKKMTDLQSTKCSAVEKTFTATSKLCSVLSGQEFILRSHTCSAGTSSRGFAQRSRHYSTWHVSIPCCLTGERCESEVKGCANNPCEHLNTTCHDNTPEEQQELGAAYYCAECPRGYQRYEVTGECIGEALVLKLMLLSWNKLGTVSPETSQLCFEGRFLHTSWKYSETNAHGQFHSHCPVFTLCRELNSHARFEAKMMMYPLLAFEKLILITWIVLQPLICENH